MPKAGGKRFMSRSDAARRLDPERTPYADTSMANIKQQQDLVNSFPESPFGQRPTDTRSKYHKGKF